MNRRHIPQINFFFFVSVIKISIQIIKYCKRGRQKGKRWIRNNLRKYTIYLIVEKILTV